MRRLSYVVSLTGLLMLGSGGLAGVAAAAESDAEIVAHAKELSLAFRKAAEKMKPSVVTVISKYDLKNNPRLRELHRFLDDPRLRERSPRKNDSPQNNAQPENNNENNNNENNLPEEGLDDSLGFNTNVGSGVITDAAGLILTNNHVVADASEVIVRLPDGNELKAKEIRTDPMSDLAVIRVDPTQDLVAAKIGNSDAMEIGDWVIAIGNPFELESTVSAGIISGKGRGIARIQRGELLQTDAAINPGNSGGPLANLDGEVVGINTAIATNSGTYQGVGFAIPMNRASWVAKELLTYGAVRRAYLGIRIGELTADAARKLKLGARSGVWILEVIAGGPAAQAGIKDNDVIVEFAGVQVQTPGRLQETVEEKEIGSSQKVTVVRDGKRLSLDVTMRALQDIAKPAPKTEKP